MLVIDHPSTYDEPVEMGTFVIIALDPLESVADLDDEEATQQASEIEPLRCLALLHLPGEMVSSSKAGGLQLSLKFKLAGHGLPEPPTSWAATPIAPAPPHPETGRPAVVPSYPLPWDDCYIHTVRTFTARVSRIYQHRTPGPSFSGPLLREVRARAGRDVRENGERKRAAALAAAPPEDEPEPAAAPATQTLPTAPEPEAPLTTGNDLQEHFPGLFSEGTPTVKMHVHLWVEINPADRLCSPEDFGKGVRRLREIEQEWAQRTVAAFLSKEPQTTAWLEGTAGADAPPSADTDEIIGADDDSIGPEDAIEHRIERELANNDSQQRPLVGSIAGRDKDLLESASSSHQSHSRPAAPTSSIRPTRREESIVGSDITTNGPASSAVSAVASSREECASSSFSRFSAKYISLRMKHFFHWVSGWIGLESLASRSRSFFWSLLWRKPFSP